MPWSRGRRPHDERSVELYEQLADELEKVPGSCADVAAAAQAFLAQHPDLVTQDDISTPFSPGATDPALTQRIQLASGRLHAVSVGCGYRQGSTSAFCVSDTADDGATPEARAMSLAAAPNLLGNGCGETCSGGLSSSYCAKIFFGCIAGGPGACCWFGICVTPSSCQIQCPNCVNETNGNN